MIRIGLVLACLLSAFATTARAQPALVIYENDYALHDVTFANGERIADLRLHYTTVGLPLRDREGHVLNAVLLLHGTTGTGKNFLAPTLANNLFGPDQPLDTRKYFVILPDGIGAGGSSKPSDGLHAHFPHYGYIDQVEMQYRLLTDVFAVPHLRLVLGTSMGGMQTWLWGERHPGFMDALVPIGAMPAAISGRNMLWREMVIRAIRDDPGWLGGEYDPAKPPRLWLETAAPLFALMTGNAERLQQAAPTRGDAIALYNRLVAEGYKWDANNMLYTWESSADYDPAPDLDKITAPLLAINFADDLVNPPELDIMAPAMKRVKHGQYVLIPRGATYGHQTLNYADIWGHLVAEFLAKN
jgi:homoserine O-acetyltransferase